MVEQWVYDTYNRIRRLSNSENYITITDYKHYFELYPSALEFYILMDILMMIDHESLKLRREREKSKSEQRNKKVN